MTPGAGDLTLAMHRCQERLLLTHLSNPVLTAEASSLPPMNLSPSHTPWGITGERGTGRWKDQDRGGPAPGPNIQAIQF